jgi:hypothetical protein
MKVGFVGHLDYISTEERIVRLRAMATSMAGSSIRLQSDFFRV